MFALGRREPGHSAIDARGDHEAEVELIVGLEVDVAANLAVEGEALDDGRARCETRGGNEVEGITIARAARLGALAQEERGTRIDGADGEGVAVADEGRDPVAAADGGADEQRRVGTGHDPACGDSGTLVGIVRGEEEVPPSRAR